MSRFNDNPEGIYDPTATLAIDHVIHEQKAKPYRPFVYICSRYAGDIQTNTNAALRYCQFAVKRGCIPIASHIFYAASGILRTMGLETVVSCAAYVLPIAAVAVVYPIVVFCVRL